MQALINWFIRNSVAANLLMVFIFVAGAISISGIRIEGFPKLPVDSLKIEVTYVGATANQINEAITQKIERAIQHLKGVKKTTSTSYEGGLQIIVQKKGGYAIERLLSDIKIKVDALSGLPKGAERPVVTRAASEFPAMIFQIYGSIDRDNLQKLGERSKQALLAQEEINQLKVWGTKDREISIELSPEKLEALNLSLSDIYNALNKNNIKYRFGTIASETQKITLRADRSFTSIQDYENTRIQTSMNGSTLLLKDIATIKDGFIDDNVIVNYQGQPAIGIEILMSQQGNIIDINKAAERVKTQLNKEFPDNIHVDLWANQSIYIEERLSLLQKNALYGLIIVFILLSLFLNAKVAFWVAMGVPISLAGTIAVMGLDAINYSLNEITTFGFIIVLGILVDDAVVVGESIYQQQSKHKDKYKGAEEGAKQVATATTFGILTSIAAFYPLLLINNPIGKVLASFSGVIIIALLFSLLESKLILPAHLASISTTSSKPKTLVSKTWHQIQYFFDGLLSKFNLSIYRPLISTLLIYRYASLVVFVALATLGMGLIYTQTIKTVFFPEIPGNYINVTMEMDPQSPLHLTLANAKILEENIHKLNQKTIKSGSANKPPVERVMTAIIGANSVQIWAELLPANERDIKTKTIADEWREMTGVLEGVKKLTFDAAESTGSGGFELILEANNQQTLNKATRELEDELNKIKGLYDIYSDSQAGQPEIHLELKQEAPYLGVTQAMLASHIGDAFGGLELNKILRNNTEVTVVLRYPKEWRNSLDKLSRSRIRTETGKWLPLSSVANFKASYIPETIQHRNGILTAFLYANINKEFTDPSKIFKTLEKSIFKKLETKYDGLKIKPSGEIKLSEELKSSIIKALSITFLLIYILLAVPLKSYWQPVIIMSVIPFGFAGAAMGHYIIDIPLSILSFFGMIALTGIVVNDSLVMLTRFNQLRQKGCDLDSALVEAGSSRFRAIFLTTVTTVGGLLPLLYETSEQAQYLIPAAVSLAFGEMFATLITLVLIPLLIRISDDVYRLVKKPEWHFKGS